MVEWTIEGGQRVGAPFHGGEMLAAKFRVSRRANGWVLRGDGTTPAKVTPAAFARVVGNALPQQAEHDEIAVLLVNAGPSEFDEFAANGLERREIKLLFAVVTAVRRRRQPGLQAIRPDDFARRQMLDEQMVADFIERVGIESGDERFGQPLVE